MRRLFLVVFVISLCAQIALAQAKAKAKPTAAVGPVPDKAYVQEIWDAWNTMNPDNVAKYYDQSPGDVFFDISPMQYKGWAAYAKGVKEVLAGFKSFNGKTNPDTTVHVSGNLAWTTATWHADAETKDGKPMPLDGRHTIVWQKKGGKWLIVHEHLSIPMAEPGKQ